MKQTKSLLAQARRICYLACFLAIFFNFQFDSEGEFHSTRHSVAQTGGTGTGADPIYESCADPNSLSHQSPYWVSMACFSNGSGQQRDLSTCVDHLNDCCPIPNWPYCAGGWVKWP